MVGKRLVGRKYTNPDATNPMETVIEGTKLTTIASNSPQTLSQVPPDQGPYVPRYPLGPRDSPSLADHGLINSAPEIGPLGGPPAYAPGREDLTRGPVPHGGGLAGFAGGSFWAREVLDTGRGAPQAHSPQRRHCRSMARLQRQLPSPWLCICQSHRTL